MTYYEELGISADASAEEIRQAHRRLVKLLHPDQHQDDEELRRLAEIQMMRVNAFVAELLDSSLRDSYDAKLRGGEVAPPPVVVVPPRVNPAYRWAACVISGLALVALLGVRSPTDSVRSAAGNDSVPSLQTQSGSPVSKGRGKPAGSRTHGVRSVELDPARSQEAAQATQQAQSARSEPATPSTLATTPPSPAQTTKEVATTLRHSAGSPLSGTWLYAGGTRSDRDKDLYPPEYIELRIREDGDVLRGDYRGRYAVTDLAIPPSVNFTFEGKTEGESWRWRGPGGSSGTLTIRLLHRNAIQVDWKVTDFGSNGAGLEFGTATLVRRL